MEKLEWTALEYEERQRSPDWFWALGVATLAAILASAIYGNYFFAALLLLSGSLIYFFALKKPDLISYELNDKGLRIGSRLYPYENMRSFWVEESPKPTLYLRVERFFMPILSVPIPSEHAALIREFFLDKDFPLEEMREPMAEKVINYLGF